MKRYFVLLTVLVLVVAVSSQQTAMGKKHSSQSSQKNAHASAKGNPPAKTFLPDQMGWIAAPKALPDGAQIAVLEGDPMKAGVYTMRLKMPAGYRIPPHMHFKREHVTVITGGVRVGMGDKFDDSAMHSFPAGSFAYLEPMTHHYAMAQGETIVQLHGQGPWEIKYVNASDDPRGNEGEKRKTRNPY